MYLVILFIIPYVRNFFSGFLVKIPWNQWFCLRWAVNWFDEIFSKRNIMAMRWVHRFSFFHTVYSTVYLPPQFQTFFFLLESLHHYPNFWFFQIHWNITCRYLKAYNLLIAWQYDPFSIVLMYVVWSEKTPHLFVGYSILSNRKAKYIGKFNIRNMMHTISNKEHQCSSVFKENLKNIDNLEILLGWVES